MGEQQGQPSSSLSQALGVNGVAICDCKNRTFLVGLHVAGPENHVRVLECAKCGHQLAVPFQTAIPAPQQDAE